MSHMNIFVQTWRWLEKLQVDLTPRPLGERDLKQERNQEKKKKKSSYISLLSSQD